MDAAGSSISTPSTTAAAAPTASSTVDTDVDFGPPTGYPTPAGAETTPSVAVPPPTQARERLGPLHCVTGPLPALIVAHDYDRSGS